MSTALSFDELFDPDFLTSLTHLRITARRVAAGGRFGEKLSRDLGAGVEFRDFRAYVPGDDLRRIDWNIYSRLGRVFLRMYEEQQDLPLYLMPDVSESMYADGALRARAALRAALALAAIGMSQNDSAGLLPFGERMEIVSKGKSGKAGIMSFARLLARLQPQSGTAMAKSLARLGAARLRPGLLVIISDFFDPAGLQDIDDALAGIRHRILMLQVALRADADPVLQGELRLRDCESGETVDLVITPAVLKRYRSAYDGFCKELAGLANRRQAGLLRLDAEEDVTSQLARLFESGGLAIR